MIPNKFPDDFEYVKEMYDDAYFPNFLVDKIKEIIQEVVTFLESGTHSMTQIQDAFDVMTLKINAMQNEFDEHDSELETVARELIADTVDQILTHFDIDLDIEEAIRVREW